MFLKHAMLLFLKKEEKPAELGIKWKTKQCLA